MPDDAHDVGLLPVGVDRVAHHLAVDGQAVVGFAMGRLPTLEGTVELFGSQANEPVAHHRCTRNQAAPVHEPAAEPFARLGPEAVGPGGHGLVAPHPAQGGPGGEGEHGRQRMPAALGAAGIGDGGTGRWEQSHLVGGQHHRRSSMTRGGFKNGARPQDAGLRRQRGHKDPLGRVGRGALAVRGAPKAFGVPHRDPVRGVGEGALEPGGIDNGCQQQHRMAKPLLPIGRQPPLAPRQGTRGQVGPMPGGQDQKPALVGQQRHAIVLVAGRPPDPAVPRRACPGGGRKAEQGHPVFTPRGHVPEGFANLGQGAQIMMRLHKLLEPWGFSALSETNTEVLQEHG